MIYEMAYGVAPFFARDIRQTYLKIMNHEVRIFERISVKCLNYISEKSHFQECQGIDAKGPCLSLARVSALCCRRFTLF